MEMRRVLNRTLIYIDALALDGVALPKSKKYVNSPRTRNGRPPTILRRSWNSVTDVPPNPCMSKQIIAITKRPGCVLYYARRSEDFFKQADVVMTMSTHMIPAVFSFSISYRITIANSLASSNVSMSGCGFVHDNMPMNGVGRPPVTMNVIKTANKPAYVRTEFDKSVYEEPILRMLDRERAPRQGHIRRVLVGRG
ncbi:hypothetical protein BKA56DRAFT_681465 [Ilyonectria sp. MPI-CAGE-AT-0026]|nr:hypothetical protein BKA56DRAFT_681465 [Ilyonectria sp. MPI-CAGE-AT-0026]